jgi:trehalose 6-phosphate synthase/phosphatase
VGVKICPTGVNTDRLQDGLTWNDSIHARHAFRQVFQGRKVFLGVDDFDVFKVGNPNP